MLKIHHAPNTRSVRIVWLLEELGLPYELNRLEFNPRDLKSDEHRARHPLGRVPVLEDDGVTLFESGAIVEYILARRTNGELKPAADSPLFPDYLQWFHYCEGMLMPPVNTIVVQTLLLPPERRNDEILGQAQRLLSKSLMPLDDTLAGRDYLIGEFSAVDIMTGHALYVSRRLDCVTDAMSNITRYINTIETRPAFKTALAA
ncbi:MAG: glutathione S-transferase family protein [Gammaproteobacteria bacterium]|jgi:glutathione S-transferase